MEIFDRLDLLGLLGGQTKKIKKKTEPNRRRLR